MNIHIAYIFAAITMATFALVLLYTRQRWYLILPATLINAAIGAQQNEHIIIRILIALLVLFCSSLIMMMKTNFFYKKTKES